MSTSSKRGRGAEAGASTSAKRPKVAGKNPNATSWGVGCLGQLGIGPEKSERKKPTLIGTGQVAGANTVLEGKDVAAVVAGGMHTAVITAEGEVYTSGCNDEGALGRKLVETEEDDSPEFSIGLAEGLEGQQAIAGSAGDSHTFVITADGKVFGAGIFRDPSGSFCFSDTVLEAKKFLQVYPDADAVAGAFAPAVQVASGADHVVILVEDPKTKKTTVLTCGSADQGQLGRVGANKCARDAPYRETATEEDDAEFVAALHKRRTTLACVQKMLRFHPVTLSKRKKVSKVFAGGWSTGVVYEDGAVFSWGLNNYDQLGHKSSKKKGTIVYGPKQAKFVTEPIESADFGTHHGVFLTKDKKVLTIGRGDTGQLGVTVDGNVLGESDTPVATMGLDGEDVVDVSCGASVTFAVTASGKAFGWGFGTNRQLTSAEEDDILVATAMTGKQIDERAVVQVAAGGQHTVAVVADK